MTMVLFAMIMATVVVMAVVIEATQSLIVLDEAESAGFEVETSETLLSFFDPVVDMKSEIAGLVEEYRLLKQVAAVGMVVNQRASVRQEGEAAQRSATLTGVNNDYLDQAEQVYHFRLRAPGFPTDATVWQALRERDDVAIVRPHVLTGAPVGMDDLMDDDELGPSEGRGPRARRFDRWQLTSVDESAQALPAIFVNVSLEDDDGVTRAGRVQVIGVLEETDSLAGGDMQINKRALDLLAGETTTPSANYIKAAPGADPRQVAAEVERAFLSSGIDATVMADRFAQGQAFTRNILRLLQGFMALGLLVGIAALGVITTRTVVERRQQVGLLRSIGYQARMVALSFVLEASFIAITGILIGAGVGIVLGENMVSTAMREVTDFTLPWGQILLVVLLAYGCALAATIAPAYQAARIYPAEALRYE
jgi:putative ABC transport system permease protein